MGIPKVSIIVPVYNAEKYLNKCIDSILSQKFTKYECILVDDCSTDNSGKICDEYTGKDQRIKVIHNKENRGVSLTRKVGLESSSGYYIQYADADDWLENTMIEKLFNKAVDEQLDMVICNYYYESDDIEKIHKQNFNVFSKEDIIKNILSIKIKSVLWNKFVKRELYVRAEYPKYNRSEDYVISIQNVFNAEKIGFIDEPLYHYRYNALSLSNNVQTKITGRIEENKNWNTVIEILNEKYENRIGIFDPELSNHVNDFKFIYLCDKELRKRKELFRLYPDSHFHRFLLRKLILKVLKCMYKIILPRKIRNIIWKKRHCVKRGHCTYHTVYASSQ